jgi:uncharacterized protein (DUF1015 family)
VINLKNYGFFPADILLPKKDFEKWAVVACDQFTSEKDYWDNVQNAVGDCPSALRIVLPEIYLGDNTEKRVDAINKTMAEYLENGVLKEYKQSMIYVERIQSDGLVRRGIVGAVNLDDYDYKSGTNAKIRATEQTVLERIPPRVAIRKEAPLELPHVLLLADDPEKTVIEPIAAIKDSLQKVYDFDLMLGGGHITGWLLGEREIEQVGKAVETLTESRRDKMMFAVGDGNHSLATAKECSKLNSSLKSKSALVEVVNIHDTAINFEPIYRVLFGVNPETVIYDLCNDLGAMTGQTHKYTCVYGDNLKEITLKAAAKLPVGTLQVWLDKYIAERNIKIDYIHGVESVKKLCEQENTLGFLFDGMQKCELFDAVSKDGSLPRKTFSMGHAEDKRYYIEARRIK